MTFGSVCSGIEAATVAWEPIGWRCAFVSEIDKFPCALLNHYYPNVPNYGDLNERSLRRLACDHECPGPRRRHLGDHQDAETCRG